MKNNAGQEICGATNSTGCKIDFVCDETKCSLGKSQRGRFSPCQEVINEAALANVPDEESITEYATRVLEQSTGSVAEALLDCQS